MKANTNISSKVIVMLMTLSILACQKDDTISKYKRLEIPVSNDASIFNYDGDYSDNGAGASNALRVGYSDQYGNVARTLVKFDLSDVPSNAKIYSVTLSMNILRSGDKPQDIMVHKVTQSWNEGTTDDGCDYTDDYCHWPGTTITDGNDVTWMHSQYNTVTWTTEGGTFAATASGSVPVGTMSDFSSAGMKSDVEAWIKDPSTNFGWILKVNENAIDGGGGEYVRYFSKEAGANSGNADLVPKLIILYK